MQDKFQCPACKQEAWVCIRVMVVDSDEYGSHYGHAFGLRVALRNFTRG
jgi:hypothetical protein